MNTELWKSSVGMYRDPFIDSEWLGPSLYVWRTNGGLLKELYDSILKSESQIMLVTAPYGFGKGAFKHALQFVLNSGTKIPVESMTIPQPYYTEIQLYRAFLYGRGVQLLEYRRDRLELRKKVTDVLDQQTGRFLLVIDDAHYVRPETMHAIKYISDLEKNGKKMCSVLLLGTDDVLGALKGKDMAQIADRLHLRRALKTFSQRDTLEYVARAVGYSTERELDPNYEFPLSATEAAAESKRLAPFTIDAGVQIHALTGGVPRYVRLLCSEAVKVRAASEGASTSARLVISPEIISAAWTSLLNNSEVKLVKEGA